MARRVALALGAIATLALGACSDDASPSPATVVAPASTTTTAPSTTIASTTTSTIAPSVTTPIATSTTSAVTTTAPPPAAVAEVRAAPGGGSGEIAVTWRGVPGANTYRVERATAPQGPFETSGVIGTDGSVTRGEGVVNLFAAGDGTFTYVEVITGLANGGVARWFRVLALGAGGTSAPSRVVCGAPPGAPAC